jgi:hypothetical protein
LDWLADSSLKHLCCLYPTSALQFQDGGVFFSVKVQVVKNPICELLMAGSYNVMTFVELFLFQGGSSLALCFVRIENDGFKL